MRHPLLSLILISLAACGERIEGEACMLAPEDGVCPAAEDLSKDDIGDPWDCDNEVVRITHSGAPDARAGVFQDGSDGCCYEVVMRDDPFGECVVGRPFAPQGACLVAAASHEGAWVELARAEHASVAAFARLQLQLMALGAPLHLLERTAEALQDEVRHARQTLAVAEEIAGEPISLGAFPFPTAIDPTVDLATFARDAVREGCIGETLSALATRRAAQACTDPAHRELLAAIADDEDRHAALSWSLVAWALAQGGPEVRRAVVEAFREPVAAIDIPLLEQAVLEEVAQGGLERVIAPAASALLA